MIYKEQIYKLPECGHRYHTNCIFHWIRSGHRKCPYCGNMGLGHTSNQDEEQDVYYNYARYGRDNFTLLRQYSRRKTAPIRLKKQFERLKILEEKQRAINKNHRELADMNGNFREMRKMYQKSHENRFKICGRIRRLKTDICTTNNIVPLILIKKRIIN